jgi:autotransporter-associated beta strand protein
MKTNVRTRRTLLGQGINSFVWTLFNGVTKFYHQQNNVVDTNNRTLTSTGQLYTEPKYSGYQQGIISGGFGINIIGLGTMVLTGNNTYTGPTTVTQGATLSIGDGGVNGSIAGNLVLNSGSRVIFNRNATSLTYSGVISGAGVLILTNSAQVSEKGGYSLTGVNTNTGGIIIDRGARLGIGIGQGTVASLSSNAIIVNSGGQIYLASVSETITNNLTISGSGWQESVGILGAIRYQSICALSGVIQVVSPAMIRNYNDPSDRLSMTGNILGSSPLTFAGTGTVTITRNTTSFTGQVNVVGGILIGVGAGGNGYIFNTFGSGPINISAGAIVEVNNSGGSGFNDFNQVVTGGGILRVRGSSVNRITLLSTFTGFTGIIRLLQNSTQITGAAVTTASIDVVSPAFFLLWDNGAGFPTFGALTGNGSVTNLVSTGGIICGNGNGSGTFTGVISGLVSVTKIGTGVQTFTGVNTATSNATINAGILAFQNTNQFATTTVGASGIVSAGTSTIGAVKALNFSALTSTLNVYAILPTSASKLTCTTLTASLGFTINVLGSMNIGIYPILVSTSGTPTPTLGTNTTGKTVTFAWSGQTLNLLIN